MLNTLSNKFAGVSSEIFAKSTDSIRFTARTQRLTDTVDDMSRRLDSLEAQLAAKDKKPGPN